MPVASRVRPARPIRAAAVAAPAPVRPVRTLPFGLMLIGSVAIAGHLAALLVIVLAAPSGPWPTQFGPPMAQPPPFALAINRYTTEDYLFPIKMTHNYHFMNNRPLPGVSFEVRLKDDKGTVIKTVALPDKDANFAVQYRQLLLARGLADDQPVEPGMTEEIAARNKKVPNVQIWDGVGENTIGIRSVAKHLVPRDRPVFRPSAWSQLLAKSYVRYLCRKYGAASGELIRHTREPLPPAMITMDDLPPITDLHAKFGEMPR